MYMESDAVVTLDLTLAPPLIKCGFLVAQLSNKHVRGISRLLQDLSKAQVRRAMKVVITILT